MIRFELDESEYNEFLTWKKLQLSKDAHLPTAGERWQFSFIPTGLGTIIKVKDLLLEDELDLSHTENW